MNICVSRQDEAVLYELNLELRDDSADMQRRVLEYYRLCKEKASCDE